MRPEVRVFHCDARWDFHDRLLLVKRVRGQGFAVAYAAKARGVLRQGAHRWSRKP